MTIFPIVVDSRPAYLPRGDARQSLLMLPLQCGTLLHWLADRLRHVSNEAVSVAPLFPVDDDYLHALKSTRVPVARVVSERTRTFLDGLEPSDLLLIVDPRCLALSAEPFRRLLPHTSQLRGARYQVALDRTHEGTREYVQLDSEGRVRRIQRYYEGHTWIQTQAVATALVPVASVWDMAEPNFTDLPRLRRSLAASGALGEDEPVAGATADLTTEAGYLQAMQAIGPDRPGFTPPAGYKVGAPGVYIGANCKVDATARLYGPLILQDKCTVGAGAVVIGPGIVGRGARVGKRSTLAQCVLAPGTMLEPDSVASQRYLAGETGGRLLPDTYVFEEDGRLPTVFAPDRPLTPEQKRLDRRRELYLAWKAVSDIVLSALALVLLSPLLAVTAAAVKWTSRGPIFFAHAREGLNGRPFRCWKFRTMEIDAADKQRELARETNEVDGPQFKLANDPRVTPLGKVLRGTNIDELPQLFNVLRREMSLIGPRPSPFRENQICVPWRMARLSVRPGITGLWQICRAERESGDFHQWIFYDILYAKNVSFFLDLRILIWTVLTGGGKRSVPMRWLLAREKIQASSAPVLGQLQMLTDSHITPAPLAATAELAESQGRA